MVYQHLKPLLNPETNRIEFPAGMKDMGGYSAEAMTAMFLSAGRPYIEGAFMTKHEGKYYLQYACPSTQYNTYFVQVDSFNENGITPGTVIEIRRQKEETLWQSKQSSSSCWGP